MEDHALIAARPGRKGTAPILLAALLGLAGCGGGGSLVGFDDASLVIAFDAPSRTDASDDLLEGSEPPDGSKADCVDRDGDRYGFGLGCLNVDCDDGDARVTDQCYCGRLPNTRAGCGCRPGEQPRPCDVDSDLSYSASDTCNVGQRTCDPLPGSTERGQWSACRAWRADYPTPTRFIGAVSQCPGNCSPQCRHQVICPESGDAIPAGSTNVVVANAAHSVFCPGGAGLRGGITTTCTSTSGGSYTRASSPLSWRDACAAPGHQTVLVGSDDGTTQVSLPFTFSFYGAPYATAGIATNGMISFVDPTYWWVNSALPTGDVANTIFAFWDDVYNRGSGECIAVYGSAPGREYVVQWSDQFFYPPGSSNATEHMTYQVVLAETTHTIDVLYNQMEGQGDRATGNSATVGIQQGTGSSFDLVGYNTAGVTPAGRTLRWTPSTGSTVCSSGVYRRVYEGTTCDGIDAPYWGQFNFSSIVPQGARIEFRVRVAQTSAGLASAPWTRLPDAPNGATSTPSSIDVGANLRAARPTAVGADHLPFLELQATLIPSPDGTLGPTLISTEVQFTCAPPEEVSCRMGAPCYIASDPCRRGVIRCLNAAGGRPVETCVDAGALPPGTSCGTGSVCNASGVCVPCNEGAACSTGLACATGRLSCATGAPLCAIASQLPVGTVCGGGVDVYTRLRPSPAPWVDVCSLAGHRTFMTGSDDGTTGESLPFTFRFYGSPYSYVGIASNGQLSFVLPTYSWVNSPLPTSAVENTIFGFWDDIYQRNGICTATVGAAPLRRYVAEWEDNFFYPPGSSNASEHLTFEISLSEGSNAIDVLYSRMEGQGDRGTGGDATIGIQRDTGSTFDLLGYNAAGVASGGSSVRWLPGSSSVCNAAAACVACANGAPCTLPGVCVIGVLDCSTGAPVCTNAGTRAPTAESCNGVDDDCDGVIDDGVSQGCYTGPSGTSGVGLCRAGSQTCTAGAWGACVGQVVPSVERCNGVDDDCDGAVDDGVSQGCYTGASGTSGVGVCRAGTQGCAAGAWGACVGQVVPGAESCNNLDDDCDGAVDDGVAQGCYTGPTGTSGVGLCRAGLQTCSMGAWSVCSSQVTPRTEVCNNLDDDCNGAIDNGVAQGCYTGPTGTRLVGRCRDGIQACATGAWGACAGQTLPAAESCNSIDDDCDGSIDEGLGTTTCGTGPCQRTVDNCVGGVVQVCVPQGSGTEVCNNLDDDCDGLVDEGLTRSCYSGVAGTSGVGLCHGGAQTCVAGSWGVTCPGEVIPSPEVCDGQDNDCNASVDEGLGLASCGVGVCARTVATCLGGTPQACLPTGPAATGRGLDGALFVASGATATIDTVRTPVSGSAGTTTLSLGSAAGFAAGRLVLLHQSQGAGAGAYEIRQIRALSGTTASIDTALVGTYSSAGSSRAQAVLVPEYTTVTVASGATLVAPSWDGSTGGILAFLASGAVTIDGAVSMLGRGFRGTQHACFNRCATGVQGESSLGAGGGSTGPNGNGGGGGSRGQDCAAGGGGAYGSAGSAGATGSGLGGCGAGTSAQPGGAGGSAVGASLDTALLFGGAGGEGGGDEDGAFAGGGGGGGGIVFVRGAQLLVRGTVSASGSAGGDGNNGACGGVGCGMGGGGGGAGGAIWLESTLAATLSGVVSSGGGVGGSCTCGGSYAGGVGGVGRIAVRAPSVSGSSSPAWAPGASIAVRVSVPGTTSAEVCNGLDDDCDGIIDDGNPGAGVSCDTGQAGVCAAGTTSCTAGGIVCIRNVGPSAELCDGQDNDCDGLVDEGYCRIGGACFSSGQLNPANNCQVCVVPSTTVSGPTSWSAVAAGTVCRPSAGVCDVAESCNGSGAACPPNGFIAAGMVCRASAGACDVAESCSGSSGACPADALSPAGTVCRAVAGVCDVAESCDGIGAACPGNGFLPSSVVCRASTSIAACDPAESCTGASALCPTNVITRAPTTELCDAIDNDCDGVADDPWVRPSGCVPGVEVCDRVDNDCDGLVDEGLAGSAACPGRSCEDIYAATMSVGSGYYWLNPTSASTAGRFEAWCDMAFDGSGWTLVGRSRPGGWGPGCAGGDGGASFGWRSAQGSVRNDAAAYSLNAFGVGLPVTQVLFGSYAVGKSWGANVFRHTVPSNFVSAWGGAEFFNGAPVTVAGPCAPGMFGWIGYTAATDQFHLRDVPGGSFGLTASGWASCYDASCYAGNINGSQGQIMARAPALSYGYLAGACTVGVGACARVGALVCTADGRGTACSVTAGSPSAEVCDGLDNDCNGLVDEGYCRIGGACFSNGQLNPANNCQVCVVPSTAVSGPTSWSAVAAGTVCRAAAGVCDVAESCNGTGATCPADAFLPSSTVCRASAGVCDVAESCTGSSAACPGNAFVSSTTVCRASAGVCDLAETCNGSSAACPSDAFTAAGTVCRASAGVCDVAESCNGSGAACPPNGYIASGTVCRASASIAACDPAESCTGSSALCPTNVITRAPTTEVCNGADDDCDGVVDDGNPGAGAACWSTGTGSCVNAGTLNCVGGTLACSATPRTSGPCTVGGGGAVSYSQPFTSGVTPGSQCTAWNTFRASLTGTYDRVTIRGSLDGTGVSCTGPSANTLCQALRNNTVVTGLSCGGRTWNVGNCAVSGYASEISADGDTCSCSAGYIVRPCIGNLNWGGVNGSTCGATDQTMVVECGGGGASTSCNSSGVCACSPTTEVCNGVDDDCDGAVDDIASTPCSPGECRTGYTYCSGASTLCAWSGNSPVGTWCSAGRCDGAGTCRPSNDRPENAIYLGSLPGGQLLTSGNTCGATTQPYAWCNGQSEIYYYVYVTQRSVLYADTFGSAFDTVLNVSSNGYDSYACNDDSCGTVQSQIAPGSPFVVNPGYYYISVGGWAGGCGAFTLRVQAVPASNPVIQVARGAGQVAYYSTAGQANMVNLGCGAAGGDITFYWTLCPGVGGGTFSANTCSGYTSYDTVAEFFDGTSGYAACNDDSCGLRSSLSVGVNAGPGIRAFYQDGWGGNVGNNYTVFSIP